MTKFKSHFYDFIFKNRFLFFIILVSVFGIFLRFLGLNFISHDYEHFLLPWWNQIEQGGINSLAAQIGNYNIPYQIMIYIMTLFPFGPLLSYKILSVIFDFLLAAGAALLVYSSSGYNPKLKAAITYGITFCSITVIINSSFWAQCDSIYASFILFALYFLKKDKNILSFVFIGIAFAFKLQTVFIFPFLIYYYISTRKISILHFFIIPAVDFIMCLPAVILGRPVWDIVSIYLTQTNYYKAVQMNCPNLYAIIWSNPKIPYYSAFKYISVLLTIILLGTALTFIIYKKVDMSNTQNFLLAAIWSVFTCVMFLPSMHERYAYLLDIIALIYAVIILKRYWLPIICTLISLRGYCRFLFGFNIPDIKFTAIIYLIVYLYVSYIFFKEVLFDCQKQNSTQKC